MTPDEKSQVKNETIEELCTWLTNCIEHVDHETDVYKACIAMVGGMRGRKDPDSKDVPSHEGQHYPLSYKP